ncbi:hypothetical protein K502DRAFT_368965 [Neoconidiobolus thromboides FSU 785]|nr:hypothetical protein K502DRAFT_368965 [Neoconidiobolus thromboides FSU 785]
MNLFDIGIKTSKEETSFELAKELGLIPPYPDKCVHCQSSMSKIKNRNKERISSLMRCNNKQCNKMFSVLAGSIFENSQLKIGQILQLLACFAFKFKVSETQVQTNISKNVIINWNNKFRKAYVRKFDSLRDKKIGGKDLMVELDRSNFYKDKKSDNDKEEEKTFIFAGLCRETKEVCCDTITISDLDALHEFIINNIEPGSIIVTTSWSGFDGIETLGYKHKNFDNSKGFIDIENKAIHVNNCKRMWQDLKKNIPNSVPKENIKDHIKEYIINRQFNCKDSAARFKLTCDLLK